MTRRLQEFDHRSSGYERPTREWVCGHAREGRTCRLGPDARGRCRAGALCAPVRRGEVWACTLPEGPCEEGPLPDGRCCRTVPPCVPRRSWRARKRRLAVWTTVVALGLLALGLSPRRRADFVSPGDLTRPHRLIESCSACHAGWEDGPQGWIVSALARGDAGVHDAACLACHHLGERPATAHGLSTEALAALSAAAADGPRWAVAGARRALAGPDDPHRAPRCAVCHGEHRGADPHLTEVADARCQTCHARTFRSFADGHPEFGTYPSTEATAIVFDHRRHFERHFAEPAMADRAPASCGDCHEIDAVGLRMTVRPFASTCATCHLAQLDGRDRPAGTKALEVLNVPGLDARTLEEAGIEVGDWPWIAEDRPTPWLALLLAERDPEGARLLADVDLLDLRGEGPEVLAAAARLAWNVKRLYGLLVLEGTDAIAREVAERLGPVSDQRLAALLQGLPGATLAAATADWFPNLESELGRLRAGAVRLEVGAGASGPPPSRGGAPASSGAVDPAEPAAGEDDLLGEDDDLLGGDDDLLAPGDDDLLGPGGDDGDLLAGGSDDDIYAAREAGGGGSSGDDEEAEDDLLAPGPDEDEDLLGASPSGDDDLLAPEDDLLLPEGDDGGRGDDAPPAAGDDLLGGSDAAADDLLAGTTAAATPPPRPAPAREPVDPEEWARHGGWFVRDAAILYRPARHPDPFLAAWIDLAAERPASPAARQVLDTAMHPDAPGQCAKCHSVDATGATPRIRWQPTAPERGRSAFTRFPHQAHFTSATGLNGCAACHRLRSGVDVLSSWEDRDPATFTPAFEPAPKDLCASCHQAAAVGDSCTSCHLYHAGDRPTTAPPLSLLSAAGNGDPVP